MIVVGALPIVTTVMACGPHPFLCARSFASQSVNEPAVDTPIRLPLSWSSERIGESDGTPILRNEGGPGGLADRSHRCTLGNERHLGAGTDPDIDTAGDHRLRHLAAAGEVDDR